MHLRYDLIFPDHWMEKGQIYNNQDLMVDHMGKQPAERRGQGALRGMKTAPVF